MVKNYPKQACAVRRKSAKKQTRRLESCVIALLALFIIGGLVYWVYASKSYLKIMSALSSHKTMQKQNKKPVMQSITNTEDVHFDFYTELPNMQMAPTTTSVPSSAPVPTRGYILYLGEFPDLSAASELRISLLLAGCDADIVKVTVGNHDVYRVQQGPYADRARANTTQQVLQKKGIVSDVRKVE